MYDAIIIGRDLSSLIAALTAVHRGLKTVLIAEDTLEAEHREAGYSFPLDPTPLSGFRQGQIVAKLLGDLRLPMEGAPQFLPMDPAFQVILPGHRVDIFRDGERLIAELIREFPEQASEIRRFHHAVAKAGPLAERWIEEDRPGDRLDFRRLLNRLVRLPAAVAGRFALTVRDDGGFRRVIEAGVAILSHLEGCGHSLPLSAAYLLSLPARGIFYPLGGRRAWIDWLRRRFTDGGGDLREECSVMRVETDKEIIVDLESSGTVTTVRGRRLIVSAKWEKLNLLLLGRKPFHRLARRFDAVCPAAYPFCLHMGVHEGGIPERLAPYSVVVPDETRPATDGNLVFLETSFPGETGRAPEGRRAVTATVFLKDSPLRLSDRELKEQAAGVIDSLEGFLPFLRESIDYLHVEKSIALSRRCQEIVNQKYHTRKRPFFGISALRQETPRSKVFLTGGMLLAGQGFEGEIRSGINAAFWAEREV
ncbi:MAG: hypothetical protein KKC25_02160 [Proteobacteria bacterium]|nr:hypothetical protein [Pseudomonadota bacterium]